MKISFPHCCWLLAAILSIGCVGRPADVPASREVQARSGPAAPLREAAAKANRHIGAAIMSYHLGNTALQNVLSTHFDSLTPENEMKWDATEPRPGEFNFVPGEKLVSFARQNGMRVRGHTLVWHSQLPPWVPNLSGPALRQAMSRHIRGLVGRWRGTISQWDVVNEALADGSGQLRDSPFLALGEDYIAEAFRVAHEADPDAQLFYNDYEIEAGDGDAKSDGAYRLCKHLKEAGVPIHGIGMQMHVDPRHWPTAEQIRQNVERFAGLGLLVEFTELDVPVGELRGRREQKFQQQRDIAHAIVVACLAVDKCRGITLWGVSDRNSWLSSPQWAPLRGHGPHLPLAFDDKLNPKPMFFGIADAFAGR